MPVDKLLNDYQYDPEAFDFNAFKESVIKEYQADQGIVQAKVNQITEQHTTALTELERQKARNYDLLQQVPAQHSSQTSGDTSDDPKETGWGDLFGTDSKE